MNDLKINYLKLTLYSGLFLLMVLILSIGYFPKNQHLNIGEISQDTIVSPKNFEIQTTFDKSKSQELLEKKLQQIEPVYERRYEDENLTKKSIASIFLTIKDLKDKKILISKIPTDEPITNLSNETITSIVAQDQETLSFLEIMSQQLIYNIYTDGIKENDSIEESIQKHLRPFQNLKTKQGPLLKELLSPFIFVNLTLNEELTFQKKEETKRNFIPQTTIIRKGQPIIYRGDIILPINLEILEKIGLYRESVNFQGFLPIIIGLLALVFVFERMATKYLFLSTKKLLLLLSLQSLYFVVLYFFTYFEKFPQILEPGLLIPVSFFSILLSLLISERSAYITTYFNILIMLLIFDMSTVSLLYVMVANSLTTVLFKNYKNRRDIPLTGLIVGAVSVIIMSVILLNKEAAGLGHLVVNLGIIFLNPILCFIIAIGMIPYLEEIFDITTNLQLLDYGDLNNELMKKLLNEAPGTYYHSLMVANLAESAATKINANGILARVAAYYHDIGKLKKPEYFIENQDQKHNPHSHTMPSLSALTILGHPKDGLEIAKKYGLPKEIQTIIHEHHGTSLLAYFYYKMLKSSVNEIVEENQFRYNTPTPSSKESAIIMLADGVEAAIRSLDKPTPVKIQSMIEKIFKDKLDDNQLDNSDLTLKNLEEIKKVFITVTSNQYHSRIKYPDQEKETNENKS